MGSALGVRKGHASRLGLTLDEYEARIGGGEKWCMRCREWHPVAVFGSDRSRADGLASACLGSRVVAIGTPGRRERRLKLALGLAWCRGCRDWLGAGDVQRGACRTHRNEMMRDHYARNIEVERPRRMARTRGLDPIPAWWRAERFQDFGFLCAYGCRRQAATLDHVWPVARGGRSEPSNLVPCCTTCNSRKRDRDPAPWIERFCLAFPDEAIALIALTFEVSSSLDMEEVA